jgi:uncharacterized protein (DUF885 family)
MIAAVALVATACTPAADVTTATTVQDPGGTTSTPGDDRSTTATPSASLPQQIDATTFPRFLEEVAAALVARYPEEVTDLGIASLVGQDNSTLNDYSPTFRVETATLAKDALITLETLDPTTLDPDDAISASVLRWYLEDTIESLSYADHDYAVSYITGAHTNLPEFLADVHTIDTADDADAYVSRLHGAGDQMRQVAANLAQSEEMGVLPTALGLGIAKQQTEGMLVPADQHTLVTDLVVRLNDLQTMTDEEVDSYRDRAIEAVNQQVLPGYETLLDAIEGTQSRSDASPGASEHPDGQSYYAAALRHHLSVDMTPAEVHEVGLTNVDRIVAELTTLLAELGYDMESRSFVWAVEESAQDAGYKPLTSDAVRNDILQMTEGEIEKAQAAVAPLFLTFPESPVEVVRPRPSREGAAGAYYRPPPAVGVRSGLYYLALGGEWMQLQTYATTNYHEAIPGHHFQIALQRESQDLPLLQRATTFGGYAEGWGLYAERLAYEADLYTDDPHGNVGRLRMELLRASRAVVDTGIHSLGWSRDDAIDYMGDLGFSRGWAEQEVDRYIVWPGQAPSYLIGMLEILRLKDLAEAKLGPNFDIADFHNEVLRHGSVPVGVLDEVITNYLSSH